MPEQWIVGVWPSQHIARVTEHFVAPNPTDVQVGTYCGLKRLTTMDHLQDTPDPERATCESCFQRREAHRPS